MRLIIQRVSSAKVVRVKDDKTVGEIKQGFFVLLGIKKGDTKREVEILSDKISKLRIMSDESDKMNLSVKDVNAKILVVSQFTLYADTSGGNRPSFVNSEDPQKAKELYEYFIDSLRAKNIEVETGSFGDYMKIDAKLDGPVTIIYE